LSYERLYTPQMWQRGVYQYNHYQEDKRELYFDTSLTNNSCRGPSGTIVKAPNALNPILPSVQ
jgi:hypothetical protein